jgi:hypothetical protein
MHPFAALGELSRFGWSGTVLFKGRQVSANDLPWDYLPTWMAVSLPEFLCLCIGFGFYCCIRESRASVLVKLGVAAFAVAFPVLYAVATHAVLYDGLRHVLFVLPFVSLLAGVGFATLLRARMPSTLKVALIGAVTFSLGLTAHDMVILHPYESIYFNRAIGGGLKVAAQSFETEYWGSSYKEGIDWLIRNYHPSTTEKIRVANCSAPPLTEYFLQKTPERRDRFAQVASAADADVFMATTRWNCDQTPGRVLYTVERMGTPLMRVIELRAQ